MKELLLIGRGCTTLEVLFGFKILALEHWIHDPFYAFDFHVDAMISLHVFLSAVLDLSVFGRFRARRTDIDAPITWLPSQMLNERIALFLRCLLPLLQDSFFLSLFFLRDGLASYAQRIFFADLALPADGMPLDAGVINQLDAVRRIVNTDLAEAMAGKLTQVSAATHDKTARLLAQILPLRLGSIFCRQVIVDSTMYRTTQRNRIAHSIALQHRSYETFPMRTP